MPKIKVNYQLIEMKLCMSQYIHKSIPDTKFEADSSSSFGDMTGHKISFGRMERVIRFGYLPPKNGFNLKEKRVFMSRLVLLDPKLTPMSISAIFKQRKIFSFSKFLGHLDEKRAAVTP